MVPQVQIKLILLPVCDLNGHLCLSIPFGNCVLIFLSLSLSVLFNLINKDLNNRTALYSRDIVSNPVSIEGMGIIFIRSTEGLKFSTITLSLDPSMNENSVHC